MDNQPDTSWRVIDTALAVIGALVTAIWTMLHAQLSKDNKQLHARISETNSVVAKHEEVYGRLFDKMDHIAQRSEDRHVEILTALHTGLNSKQDKT
jgi:hypothetical protein